MAKLPMRDLPPGPLQELMIELHTLHARAGWPSTREIAKGHRFSYTTVHELFTKTDSLPKLPLLLAVVSRLTNLAGRMDEDEVLDDFDARWTKAARTATQATTETGAIDFDTPEKDWPALNEWQRSRITSTLKSDGMLRLAGLGERERLTLFMLEAGEFKSRMRKKLGFLSYAKLDRHIAQVLRKFQVCPEESTQIVPRMWVIEDE